MGQRLTDHEGLRVEPAALVKQSSETTPLVVVGREGVLVVNGVDEPLVGDVQQGHPRGLVDAAGLRLDDAVLDLVTHAEPVTTTDGIGFQDEGDLVVVLLAIDGDGYALFEGDRHFLGVDLDVRVPELDAHDGLDGLDRDVQGLKRLGFVGGAPDVGVGGVGLLLGIAVGQVVGGEPGAHLVAAAELQGL